MIRALLFDLDGTLVDTNAKHVDAWAEAFEVFGHRVGLDRIEQEIGKGGDLLVTALLGHEVEDALGPGIRDKHREIFEAKLEHESWSWLPGAKHVLAAARAAGLKTAIATSSTRPGLAAMERTADVRFADWVDVVSCKDESTTSKPAPDVIERTCELLGEERLACAMVGDSLHDAAAARRAGVAFIGSTTGYVARERFVVAGARFVARDLEELANELSVALGHASHLNRPLDALALDSMMAIALDEAREGLRAREVPIGAAIFDADGRLLSSGHNRVLELGDPTHHAESDAFRKVHARRDATEKPAILVSTLEPCVMCLGAAMEVGVDVVLFGLEAPEDGGIERVSPPRGVENLLPRTRGGVSRQECRALLVEWQRTIATESQRPFVDALLRATEAAPSLIDHRAEDAA